MNRTALSVDSKKKEDREEWGDDWLVFGSMAHNSNGLPVASIKRREK